MSEPKVTGYIEEIRNDINHIGAARTLCEGSTLTISVVGAAAGVLDVTKPVTIIQEQNND